MTERKPTMIHPALDYTSTNAYVGHMLPIPGKAPGSWLCLIRDDGAITPCKDIISGETDIQFTRSALCIPPRWSIEEILRFSKGRLATIEKDELLAKVKKTFQQYIELPDETLYDLLSLWCIGTYFFPLFNTYPYVYVGGITGSGKSKLLGLCSQICFNGILSPDMTESTVFRLIHNARSSLFFDETDDFRNRFQASNLRRLLLTGYKKGSRVIRNRRTSELDFVPEFFDVYGPKMFGNIEGLEEVLESRCIRIIMKRGSNVEITSRAVSEDDQVWQETRDLLYPFLMKNWQAVKHSYSEIKPHTALQNRSWEIWKPILSLAQFFDEALLQKMKSLAIGMAKEVQRDQLDSPEYVLAKVLLTLVQKDGYYMLKDIRNEMARYYDDSDWLSERSIGGMLRSLGFKNRRRRRMGFKYLLKASEVRGLAEKLGISEDSEHSEGSVCSGEQDTQIVRDVTEFVEKEKCQEEKSE